MPSDPAVSTIQRTAQSPPPSQRGEDYATRYWCCRCCRAGGVQQLQCRRSFGVVRWSGQLRTIAPVSTPILGSLKACDGKRLAMEAKEHDLLHAHLRTNPYGVDDDIAPKP
jgi:hypothetical protein